MSQDPSLDASISPFDKIKRVSRHGSEFWTARSLMPLLGYSKWSNFKVAISRARIASTRSGQDVQNHFSELGKMVSIGSGASRQVVDYHLSRYACYLIAQNGDPSKTEVALAQTYFAVQTRKQEMRQATDLLEQRLALREEVKTSNKRLASAALNAGVQSSTFGVFQDEGYRGLYANKALKQVKAYKGISDRENLLDRIGPQELAANNFRATQTEERLLREGVLTQERACQVHREVGRDVRSVMMKAGNTPPEKLPVMENIKPLVDKREREQILAKEQMLTENGLPSETS